MKKRKPPSTATPSRKKTAAKPRAKSVSKPGRDEITRSSAFRKSTTEAESYLADSTRLQTLLRAAREQINHLPRGPFAETWPYLLAMIRLIRAHHQGEYRDVSSQNLVLVVAAMSYVVSPLDVIPDSVPVLGHIDDAQVIRLALESVRADLDTFMAWETAKV